MTPAKPVRAPKALASADGSVSPLTETGSAPGSYDRLVARALKARAFRNVGAELQRAGGGARRQTVEPKSACEVVGEIVRDSDDETTVVGGGGALDVGDATRAPSREQSGMEGIRLKLDRLMDVVGAVDERSRSRAGEVHNLMMLPAL